MKGRREQIVWALTRVNSREVWYEGGVFQYRKDLLLYYPAEERRGQTIVKVRLVVLP